MTQRSVEIETADGTCPAALSIPAGEGPWPGVIMFPDAGGMRDTMRQMGERLSDWATWSWCPTSTTATAPTSRSTCAPRSPPRRRRRGSWA